MTELQKTGLDDLLNGNDFLTILQAKARASLGKGSHARRHNRVAA